jgi:hypothetical protein
VQAADWIALWSLVIAVLALIAALWAIFKSNRNSSVATLVTLLEATREAWKRYFNEQEPDEKWSELCEIMNLLEIAAAILNERSFAGVSKSLVREYLNEAVSLLRDDECASADIEKMFTAPTTFEHIQRFYKTHRSQPLSVTVPKQWFQM